MLETLEFIVAVLIIVWVVDHVIFRGKSSTKFWIIVDITCIFLLAIEWLIENFL